MLPIGPSLDLNFQNVVAICHKETQTSSTNLKDSSTTTGLKDDKGSLKIFEFSEVVQDPKHPRDITIIKDVFAEEIHDHNSPSGSVTDDAVANRYRYCREVIKPYLKDYPKDCPVSDDQLIRDALDAAHEDFPDYEPCFEGYDGNPDTDNNKNGSSSTLKDSNKSGILAKDSNSTCKKGKHIRSDFSKTNLSRNNTSTNLKLLNMDQQQKEGCPEKVKPKGCPSKAKPGCPQPIEVCKDEALWPPVGPPACQAKSTEGTSRCKDRVPSAGPCNEKPAAPPKKEKSCDQHRSDMSDIKKRFGIECDSTTTPPKQKTMIEAHSEAIATIKSAVEDFFGKVYQSTKDAVTIIRTESVRHLGRITAKKSVSSSDILPQKVHENKSSETITSFNYFRSTDNPDSKTQSTDSEEPDDTMDKAGQVIGKIFAKVDSTLSMLSDHIDLQKVKSLITFEDLSSRNPYDKTKSEEPAATTTSVPNSVFTAIKSRIVSMFSDGETTKENESQRSNVSGQSSLSSVINEEKRKKH